MSDKEPSILYIDPCQVQELGRQTVKLLFWTNTQKWGRFKAGHFLDQFIRLTWKLCYYVSIWQQDAKLFQSGWLTPLDSFVPIEYSSMVNDL